MKGNDFQHQNAQNTGRGQNLVVAHTLHGSPVGGAGGQDTTGPIQRSTQTMMRPYDERRRRRDNQAKTLCAAEGCRSFPTVKYAPWCIGHAHQKGLTSKVGRHEREVLDAAVADASAGADSD